MEWFKLNHEKPQKAIILKAAKCIKKGGLVIFPTDTFYGLAAMADNPIAVSRVFKVKERSLDKALTVLVASYKQLLVYVEKLPPIAESLISVFWPGSLTIVFQARPWFAKNLQSQTGKIGFRISSHPVALELTRLTGAPITATSANFSGSPPVNSLRMLPYNFLKQVDMILECKQTPGGDASSIIDVTRRKPVFLRKASLAEKVEEFLTKYDSP